MAFNRMSVATISSPEFINIEGISPFASKCEVKVLYLGGNRNGSYITKEVATQMAQTLPGVPIVGYYSENQEDFRDHGDQMIIDGDGVKFKCLTTPYGFVAPNAKVWFQNFEDTDKFGNKVERTYLMTEGYLWTEQYKAAQQIINEGRPQSMELDEKTLKGHWSTDNKKGIDFFIINDAIFSKLCILGEDVEPCFEGANITAPSVSSTFTKDDKFTHTLYTMMNELKELISNKEGGNSMEQNKEFVVLDSTPVEQAPVVEPVVEPAPAVVEEPVIEPDELDVQEDKKSLETEDKADLENSIEIEDNIEDLTENNTEFVKKEDDEEKKDDNADGEDKEDSADSDKEESEDDEKKKEKVAKNSLEDKFALLEQELESTKNELNALKEENASLLAFKAEVEDKEKDELINSFYMLSDEDKKNVIENKSKYTLDEIEKELSVICVRKKVNFNLDEEETVDKTVPTTFSFNGNEGDELPAWLKAVEDRRNAE